MPKTRLTDEQVAFALRQAEAGTSVGEICRKMGVAEATFYRWKKVHAGMGVSEIRRLKQLEEENSKLKRLVADAGQGHAAGCARKKVVKPARRREVIRHYQEVFALSERRACRAMGFGRASHGYRSRRAAAVALRMRLKEPAEARVRYGYGRLHDFLSDKLFDGRPFRILTIVDCHTREALATVARTNFRACQVVEELDRIARQRRKPRSIRVDNGPEFAGRLLDQWAYLNRVELDFSRPGKPADNAFMFRRGD